MESWQGPTIYEGLRVAQWQRKCSGFAEDNEICWYQTVQIASTVAVEDQCIVIDGCVDR